MASPTSPTFTEENCNFFRVACLIGVQGARALRQVLVARLHERETHLSDFLDEHKDQLESFRKGGGGKTAGKDAKAENSATNKRGTVMCRNGTSTKAKNDVECDAEPMMEEPKKSGKNARKNNPQLIFHDQWKLMYPQVDSNGRETTAAVNIDRFDITLVGCIIRIMQIIDPFQGELIVDWLNEPDTKDKSWAANVRRLQTKRNDLFGHTADLSLDRTTFELEFENLRDIITGLGVPVDLQTINALKMAPISDGSKDFKEAVEELRQYYATEVEETQVLFKGFVRDLEHVKKVVRSYELFFALLLKKLQSFARHETTHIYQINNASGSFTPMQIGYNNVMHINTPPSAAAPTVAVGSGRPKKATKKIEVIPRPVNDSDINLVACEIGSDWRKLGRSLGGVSDAEIDCIEHDYQTYGLQEFGYQVLRRWREANGDNVTMLTALVNALVVTGRADIALHLQSVCLAGPR